MRYITLPANNMRVTLGQYVAAVKMAIANPDREFKHGLTTWWGTSGAEIRQQFFNGLQDRINQGISYSSRGF